MIYLLGHIVFASAFTLCLKWIQTRGRQDVVSVGAINYITAALLIFPTFNATVSYSSVDTAAALTGATMGACYFAAFFFVIFLIKWVGAASSMVVGSLSILIPISIAALLWNEVPNAYQWVGISLAVGSLSLIGVAKSARPASTTDGMQTESRTIAEAALTTSAASIQGVPKILPMLLGFFVIAGSSRVAQRAFGHLSTEAHRPTFLFSAFAVAGVASIVLLLGRRKLLSGGEWCTGIALGTTNILHTHFLMRSLDRYPGYVVFPVASAGGLILTTFIATQLMGEQTSRQTRVGISMAVIALVLLNVNW